MKKSGTSRTYDSKYAPLLLLTAVMVLIMSVMINMHHHRQDGRLCICAVERLDTAHSSCDHHHDHGSDNCPKASVWDVPQTKDTDSRLAAQQPDIVRPEAICVAIPAEDCVTLSAKYPDLAPPHGERSARSLRAPPVLDAI